MNQNIKKQPFDTNRFKHLNTLIHVYVVILMVSNLVGQKITNFGSFYFMGHTFDIQFSGAQLLFPITYIPKFMDTVHLEGQFGLPSLPQRLWQ